MENQTWQLRWGHEVVGTLELEAVDMFWTDLGAEGPGRGDRG